MRIGYFGLENRSNVICLCNELAKLGHYVQAHVCPVGSYDDYKLLNLDEKLEIFDYKHSLELLSVKIFMVKSLKTVLKFKPDVLFGSHCQISDLMSNLSRFIGKPYVIQLLDIPTWLIEMEEKRRKQWSVWIPTLKKAKTIIVNHEVGREELKKGCGIDIPPENVVIYGINTEIADMVPDVDLSKEPMAVVSASRFVGFKANHAIIEALAILKKIGIDVKYYGIGVGDELKDCQTRAQGYELDATFYPGVSDFKKWELIKKSRILIYPQQTEHIGGLPPYEAFYAERSVIVSDYRILHDLYGDYPVYFKKGRYDERDSVFVDVESLTERMCEMIENYDSDFYATKRIESKKYTEETATFKTMAKGINNVLENSCHQ